MSTPPHSVVLPSLRQRSLQALFFCCQAAWTVLKVLQHAVISSVVAFVLTFLLTLGNVVTGKPPAKQPHVAFVSSTIVAITSIHCWMLWTATALSMRSLHRVNQPKLAWTFRRILLRLATRTGWLYLVVHVLAFAATSTITSVDDVSEDYKVDMYLAFFPNTLFRAGVDEASRTIFQRETAEGIAKGHVNTASYWKRLLQACLRSMNFAVMTFLAVAFVHSCSSLAWLLTPLDILLFSVGSVVFKSIVLAVTKHVALKREATHLDKIYQLTAVPTVIINTQVRLLILRLGFDASFSGFLLLALLEPVVRIFKVWALGHKLRRHERTRESLASPRIIVAQPTGRTRRDRAVVPMVETESPPRIGARQNSALDWKQTLLHFHAAETHADMCSEYIAIACSVAMHLFFRRHPKFGWQEAASEGISADVTQAVLMVVYQMGIEMVVDFVCSSWEIAHGIPLHSANHLGVLLTALLTGSALTSISISAMLFMHK